MTLTHDRQQVDAHAESHGAWVPLRNFPACEVWVSDDEVHRAFQQHGRGDHDRTRHNIAIGIRAGSYPLSTDERTRRIKPLVF